MKLSTAVKTASLILGIALSVFAVSLVVFAATTWVGPPGPPPNCPANFAGCDTPIHTGTASQVKRGNLGIGIGTTSPTTRLDIEGQIRIRGGNPTAGRVLTSVDSTGLATWGTIAGLPTGTSGQTLRHDGANWVANSVLFNNGANVGIGTTSPGSAAGVARVLEIASGAHTGIVLTDNDAGGGRIELWNDQRNLRLWDPTIGDRMFWANTGNVGIGIINPTRRLDVAGDIRTAANHIINHSWPTVFFQDTDHRSSMIHTNSNILYFLRGCGINSLDWCTIHGRWPLEIHLENNDAFFGRNVSATAFFYHSDRNLKKEINPLRNSLARILGLGPVSYKWKESGKPSIGLIAQDVERIFPEIVSTDNQGQKAVDYAKLVAPLIGAIQEQQAQIERQQKEIQELRDKIEKAIIK